MALTDGDTEAFKIVDSADDMVPAGGENTSWQVRPAMSLGASSYSAELTVTYTGGKNGSDAATATVTLVVKDDGGDPDPDPGPGPDPGNNGNSGSSSRSSSSGGSSGNSGSTNSQTVKSQIPTTAATWDGIGREIRNRYPGECQ